MDRYESYADRQIREALDQGAFDALPGRGRPLADLDRPYDAGWWARRYVERERARDALYDLAAATERALGRLWTLEDEAAVRTEVSDLNRRIDDANRSVPEPDRLPRIDVEWAVGTWTRMARMRTRAR
jgi:hypothetical protein